MNNTEKYQKFCNYLKDEYIKRISGESSEDEYIIGERPSDKIIIGILDSLNSDWKEINNNFIKYESIPLVKINFFLNKEEKGKLKINLKGNLFYNILPTFEDQKKLNKNDKKENLKSREESQEDGLNLEYCNIVNRFKRLKIDNYLKNIEVDVEKLIKNGIIDISSEVNSILDSINMEDSIYFNKRRIPVDKIKTRESFNEFLNRDAYIKQKPNWQFQLLMTSKKIDNEKYIATLILINKTPKSINYNAKIDELLYFPIPLYNVGVEIIGENVNFENNRLPYFENSYKVDPNTKVKGEWISAEFDEKENKIYTKNIPEYVEYRRKTNDYYNENTKFENLIKNPVNNLNYIYHGMKKYLDKMIKEKEILLSENVNCEEYDKDLDNFKQEMKRFKIGIEIIEDYDEVRKAFEYMNKTFSCNTKYKSWRLFQLVYIVSMISDIIYNEHKDELIQNYKYNYNKETEILYFPTGGGKTEAFLGCATFTMFYDRIVGKNYGVSTIIKYPLRLLSIQQLDRCLTVIINANNVMDNSEELKNKEHFSLGYLVGSSNTPNVINQNEISEIVNKEEYKLIDKCPKCGHKIKLRYNEEKQSLEHYCEECDKALPLYIVDDEIYRFLPTILISIVDKLTQISFSKNFKSILGGSRYRCKKHGFSHNKKCLYDINCKMEDEFNNIKVSLAPTLFIQDELHLLKESLGAFSAHYESFCKYYINELLPKDKCKQIKYIGATATISGTNNLIENLYGEKNRIFPCNLINSEGENFYSYIDKSDISRDIIGFAPYGRSVNAGMEYSVTTLRIVLYDMYTNSSKYIKEIFNNTVNEEEFKKIVFYYWTTIVYFNSKNDNNKLRNTFDQQANIEHLGEIPDAKFNIVKMTGDEDFTEIKDTLNEIQSNDNKIENHNLILATSTISHGVDEDEFNNIFFYGVPSNTAEYIQSYSRVGRKYEGLVIDIIRLARARDVSYLNFFNLFHKYKDYLICNVPINSTSINSMKHTFPGIFIGLLNQYYSVIYNKDYTKIVNFVNAIKNDNNNLILDIYNKLISIYNTDRFPSDEYKREYNSAIEKELCNVTKKIFEKFNSLRRDSLISKYMDEFTTSNTKVMTSLRDVDETVNITINFRRYE